jgi:lipid-binding SYLF domain-containing protein
MPQCAGKDPVADMHFSMVGPSAIGTAGMGVGTQAGAEVTDVLIVLSTQPALVSFPVSRACCISSHTCVVMQQNGLHARRCMRVRQSKGMA